MKKKLTLCLYCEFAPPLFSEKKTRCPQSKKMVNTQSKNCKKFSPKNYFRCLKSNQRIHFAACIGRRLNTQLSPHEKCKKCRQFETEILPIITSFGIEMQKRPKKKKGSTITRREKTETIEEPKSKITRRGKTKIARRKKSTITRRGK